MSERRTELIRVRLTPSEKAQWEAAAVREDKSVSELIRSAIDQRISLNEAAAKLRETFGPKAKDVDVDCNVYNTTRDNERCPHGSPPWAFCGTCFEAGVTR